MTYIDFTPLQLHLIDETQTQVLLKSGGHIHKFMRNGFTTKKGQP